MGDRNVSGPDDTCQGIAVSARATLLSVLIFILLGTRVKQGKAEASQGMEEQRLLLPGCERSTSLSCLP